MLHAHMKVFLAKRLQWTFWLKTWKAWSPFQVKLNLQQYGDILVQAYCRHQLGGILSLHETSEQLRDKVLSRMSGILNFE